MIGRGRESERQSTTTGGLSARRASVANSATHLIQLHLEALDLAVSLLEILVETVAFGDEVLLCTRRRRSVGWSRLHEPEGELEMERMTHPTA